MKKLLHVCEVCKREEILDSESALKKGWDYPPFMGTFGVVSPRTCPDCRIKETVWYDICCEKKTMEELNDWQKNIISFILLEPYNILIDDRQEFFEYNYKITSVKDLRGQVKSERIGRSVCIATMPIVGNPFVVPYFKDKNGELISSMMIATSPIINWRKYEMAIEVDTVHSTYRFEKLRIDSK